MTREEDFKEEGRIVVDEYARKLEDYTFGKGSMAEMFVQGAIYADKHPRKGLWDSKKVIEFIKENVREYHKSGVFHVGDFINDLPKAMED